MAVFMLSNASTPLYAHWQCAMGFDVGVLTLIFSAYILGLLLTLAFAGQLADHYGRKAVLIPCMLLAGLAALLFIVAQSVMVLLFARLLTGAAVGLVIAAGMANVIEQAPESMKNSASLIASVAMVAGAGIGPLLAGFIAQYYQYEPVRIIFGFEVGCIVLASLVVLRLPSDRMSAASFRFRLPAIPREHWWTVGIGVVFFGPGITATSFVLSLGPRVLDSLTHEHNPLYAGLMAFAMFMSAVIVQYVARYSSNRSLFYSSATFTTVAMISAVTSLVMSSIGLMLLCAIAAGAGQGLGQLGGLRLIAARLPVNRRAEANALFNMAGYLPAGSIPVLGGYLVDVKGLAFAILVLAVLIGLLVAVALVAFWCGGQQIVQYQRGRQKRQGPRRC